MTPPSIRSRMRASHAVAVVVAVAVAAAIARSAPASSEAPEPADPAIAPPRAEFKRALEVYDAGDYPRAIAMFEELYRTTRSPALLFNIAQAARLGGDCRRAVAHYRRFLLEAPAAADRPRAETWIAALDPCPAPAAAIAPAPPPPTPSNAAAVVTAAPAPRVVTPSRHSRALTISGIGLLAVSAVAAGAGTMAASQAAGASEQTSRLFREGGMFDASAAAIERDGRRAETTSIVMFSTALVCLAAGAVLLWVGRPKGADR